MQMKKEYQDHLRIIEERISEEGLLCQLAEEAVELAQALSAYEEAREESSRHLRTYNAFFDSPSAEWGQMREETADVGLVIETILECLYDKKEKRIFSSISETMAMVAKQSAEGEKRKTLQRTSLELAKAALKLKRAAGTENKPVISKEDAREVLLCKAATLYALADALFTEMEQEEIQRIKAEKAQRWVERMDGSTADRGNLFS